MWPLICGNGIAAEVRGKKMVYGNGIAEIEERDIKNKNFKKYAYSYSFSIFLTEAVWFVCMSCSLMVKVPYKTIKDKFKYNECIYSYSKIST